MNWNRFNLVCQCSTQNSETLYVVFITINLLIIKLYVVFDLICFHLSFTVNNEGARTHRGESI